MKFFFWFQKILDKIRLKQNWTLKNIWRPIKKFFIFKKYKL